MEHGASLVNKFRINESNLAQRRHYIRLQESDRQLLMDLIPWAQRVAPQVAKEFYDWQFAFGPTRQFFEGMAAKRGLAIPVLRQKLEQTQAQYFVEVFTGAQENWGAAYYERRLRIGMIHDIIDLPQKWYMGAYSEYQHLIRKFLRKHFWLSNLFTRKISRAEISIMKIFNYDQQAVCDSFLFNTIESFGLSIDAIRTVGTGDVTEHVGLVKNDTASLLKQAEAISEQRMNDPVLNHKVAGKLGRAFGKMAENVRQNLADIGAKVAQIESSMKMAQEVVDEVNRVAEELKEGRLSERAESGNAEGTFLKLVQGFNTAVDNILEPVGEALTTLKEMSKGDLRLSLQGAYQGDHAMMKDAMNLTLASLNEILGQVSITVRSVVDGSLQVSDTSQLLAEGATKQASSLQEITASMTEIGAQTKQNADNATQASVLTSQLRGNAEQGNSQMQQMLSAMTDIHKSSQEISKIIKAIDEIAFQTNLLSLNAAVEAARAGVHGKGFAVVAEEVRNLAQRSAKAAKETTALIETSVKSVENGSKIADTTAKALGEIVGGITKVTDLVGEIASASKEQALGIDQVSAGLAQIDQVTQSNTASAEQSAAAAQELSGQAQQLSGQAQQLQETLQTFRLKDAPTGRRSEHSSAAARTVSAAKKAVPATIGGWGETTKPTKVKGNGRPADVIALDDDEFGKF